MDAIRTIEWEGIRLAWRERGRGPVLVLLHGWGASARFWEPAVARLAGRFRCLALDWPGYGRSGRPGRAVGLAGHAAALEAFLRRVAGPGAVVVGHSMG
ncbi:MAG: alpha/beta fold hydrolase, partial [Nitrospirae bacterium]